MIAGSKQDKNDKVGHLDGGSMPVISRGKQVLQAVSDIVGASESANGESSDVERVASFVDLDLLRLLTEDPFDIQAVAERLMQHADQD